jgi:hypothetical protein
MRGNNQMLENLEWTFHEEEIHYIRRDIFTVEHIHTFERVYENRIISSVNFASKNYTLSEQRAQIKYIAI